VWVNKIMEKADVLKTTGLSIAKMPQIMCMAPRARYDFEFHQTFFHMRSGAADYKIKFVGFISPFPFLSFPFFLMIFVEEEKGAWLGSFATPPRTPAVVKSHTFTHFCVPVSGRCTLADLICLLHPGTSRSSRCSN